MRFWGVRIGSIALAIGGCLLLQVIAEGSLTDYWKRLLLLASLYVTLSVSLNLINGITGQFSIGHAAFYQVGAYTSGFLTVTYYKTHQVNMPPVLWLLLMIVVGGFFAGIAGFVVGAPSLRLRGDYLAIVTLGFGEILRIFTQNIKEVGLAYGFSIDPKIFYVSMGWMLAVFAIALCRNLLKTAHGLQFLAVREDEIASLAMGVNIKRTKIAAFVIGSALAGAAGAILAHGEGFINNQTFGMDVSFIILTMVVLGGTGSITGSVISAIALFALPEILRSLKDSAGDPLKVTAAWFIALFIASIAAIAVLKRLSDHYHGPKQKKVLYGFGSVLGAIALQWILTKTFSQIPSLVTADKTYEIGTLRMVLFAGTLVFAMLLKPKGLMGHREFSIGNLGGLLGPKPESPGVEH